LFAGDGPLKDRIENKIIEYSLRETVLLIGFIPAISEVVNISDIILLPSMNEVFGYAILEAMSFGKPVFATSVDAIPELVKDGVTGELFNKDRLFEICGRLNYFVDDRSDLIKMGAAGKSILQKSFALESMIAGTEKVYEQVLSAGLTA
jgi:glycosyltransferase involved in cell wall biosynthesis